MARVHHRKARKDYPDAGVKRGDMYYTWSQKTGPRSSRTYRQMSAPTRQQLTTSEYYKALWDLEDQVATVPADNLEELASAVEQLVSDINALGDEQQEKFDNLPESLQSGPTGELLTERCEECQNWAQILEGVDLDEDSTTLEDALDEVRSIGPG